MLSLGYIKKLLSGFNDESKIQDSVKLIFYFKCLLWQANNNLYVHFLKIQKFKSSVLFTTWSVERTLHDLLV